MIRALILCLGLPHAAQAQDPTLDQITAAVAQVESGVTYRGFAQVSGLWRNGDAGEVGPWQMLPVVLREAGHAAALCKRPHQEALVLYEVAFRDWYGRLLVRTGSHRDALAAYHRGFQGRFRMDAKEYAERVLCLASVLDQQTP
jgi:hypothetical protein